MSPAPTIVAGYPPSRFKMVYFLYDENHIKETDAIRNLVEPVFHDVRFLAPWDSTGSTKWTTWGTSVRPILVENALMVGVGEAGSVAAHLQECFPELNLSVVAVNSPTEFRQIRLEKCPNRVALYSNLYEPIKGLCETWPTLSDISFDVSWLAHGILSESGGNICKHITALLLVMFIREPNIVPKFSRICGEEYEARNSFR